MIDVNDAKTWGKYGQKLFELCNGEVDIAINPHKDCSSYLTPKTPYTKDLTPCSVEEYFESWGNDKAEKTIERRTMEYLDTIVVVGGTFPQCYQESELIYEFSIWHHNLEAAFEIACMLCEEEMARHRS